ncbi:MULTISPECIES: type I restriction enzyme HsdR N-terminal domain-containing protein [Citrobacter]|nr:MULTISPECIES: type I restriction enzyme HsdR N-terminal domain-containing protein [Citrobacter]EFH4604601.1 S1 RNA-binding domain-containing protein [Escherichia coli]AYL52871.1 RNA-binding protein [Citrobacter freundii]EGY1299779.1 S1 RNA-binding domain-containing protein [Escherichia coli]EJD6648907.1 S1 RNA-binding domain-containing protein [Citrobacter freundii]EJT7448253.1 S1 RNA-binding domain-containing protein [Escherichia coli]
MSSKINKVKETESDIEQKIIYPFLTKKSVDGLGINKEYILTKRNIKSLEIGKGSTKKIYYPDYLVIINGVPVLLVEAKTPGEDLDSAFQEARLYALELNAKYESGMNPLTKIIATDGYEWLAGEWDNNQGSYRLNEISPVDKNCANFLEEFSFTALSKLSEEFIAKSKPRKFWKPRRMMGGKAAQNEEVGHNSFGATLISEYGNIFNPNTLNDRQFIAREGYISSKRRDRYTQPIDKIIRAAQPVSNSDSKLIEDTDNPKEIIEKFRGRSPLENKILLIVGSVGSGKTTFIDHLKEVALPNDIIKTTLWLRFNMNESPVSSGEVYDWLRGKIIQQCKLAYPDIDFDLLDNLKKLYSVEINKFNKGEGQLLSGDEYNKELFKIIRECKSDLHETALAYTRYCGTERGKLVVIVLDNCDKRTLSEQLLMFQAAQWLQNEFRSLIILPLREETYDNYRDRPPLDTALKDMVFRIEPPLFNYVLHSRVQLVLKEMTKTSASNTLSYSLPNGFNVEYSKDERSYYLTSIANSIFVHDAQIRRMIVGLSGRNIRRALEIFLEFCTSGHITEGEFLKIRQSEGRYALPLHIVTRVLLRLNRRFYDSDNSYLKNIFSTEKDDERANHFTRFAILKWFYNNFGASGPTGLKGYFPLFALKNGLVKFGFSPKVITREVDYLLQGQCLVSEDFRETGITDEDLLRLSSAGFVHLDMLSNISYLAALAEDTLFPTEQIARRVSERMGSVQNQYNKEMVSANAKELVDFLVNQRETIASFSGEFISGDEYHGLTDIQPAIDAVKSFAEKIRDPEWAEFEARYQSGDILEGTVRNCDHRYGVFVNFTGKITGLIHKSKLPAGFNRMNEYSKGKVLWVRIENDFNAVEQKISLSLVEQ